MELGLRVASLNLRAYPNHDRVTDLAHLVAGESPDIVLLQECRHGWLNAICELAGLRGVHAHDAQPALGSPPPDGCAVAVRPSITIRDAWRIAPEQFSPEVVSQTIDEPLRAGYEVVPRASKHGSPRGPCSPTSTSTASTSSPDRSTPHRAPRAPEKDTASSASGSRSSTAQ
jgi:hypothetical protein